MNESVQRKHGGKAFQSVLTPHFDFIREQRHRRKTWREIAESLAAEKGIRVCLHTVYYFYKRRLKRLGHPNWEDDLGGFRQYVHRREAARRVELVTELSTDILRGNAWRLLKQGRSAKVTLSVGMPLDDKDNPLPGEGPRLFSYEVEAGGRSVLRLSRHAEVA